MQPRLAYQPQLDGVRALAVLAVIASHTGAGFTAGGALGVDIFFVLSGYLITTLALNEHQATGRIDLLAFYRRRVRRLAPALFLVVTATALVYGLALPWREAEATIKEAPAALFYAISWMRAFRIGTAGDLTHTWSLSVEEHFYLIWPFVLIILASRGPRAVRRGILIIAALTIVYALAWAAAGADQQRLYFAPDTRFYSLATGCALAALIAHRRSRITRPKAASMIALVVAVAAIAAVMVRWNFSWLPYYRGVGVGVVLCAAYVIGHLVTWPKSSVARLLSNSGLVWIGRRSYGLYLWQVPVIEFFNFKLHSLHAGRVLLGISATFLLAALSYRYVERPILDRRTVAERGELAVPPAVT